MEALHMVRVGRSEIDVVRGDITEQDTEAIVNAANSQLWMGAGVAGAIKRKGGGGIEREALEQGPIPVGEAVVTSGGALNANYVIHAAGMGPDLKTDAEKVTAATRSALARAEEREMASVAFPAIGTGVGGLSAYECAKVMIAAAVDHLLTTECIRRVVFVLFDQGTCDIFHKELLDAFSLKK